MTARPIAFLDERENFPYAAKPRSPIVVIACSTSPVVALEALRGRFPIPFVGVVPAIKAAAAGCEQMLARIAPEVERFGLSLAGRLE